MNRKVTQHRAISFLWVTILCFISIMAYGQNNLQKYYEYVNKAELAICRENYEEAGEFYKQAFAEFPPFGRDLHFASLLNYKYLNNEEEALKYAYILQQMNYGIVRYFLGDEKEKYPALQKKLEMMQDTVKVLVIPELEEALEKLYDADQNVRKKGPEDGDFDKWMDTIRFIDSVNLLTLQALYQKYGEINERNAGMGFSYGSAYLVLLHNHYYLHDPESLIFEEVMKGNFNANNYMELKTRYLMQAGEMDYYACHNVPVIHDVLFLLEPENVEFVNQKRKEIYISETWEDYKEKALHCFYQKSHDFRLCNLKSIAFGNDEDDEKEMSSRKSKIDSGEIKGSYYTKE